MKLLIYSDGAARGNPGPAGIGVVIKHGVKIIEEISEYIGEATNNVAEYHALIRGLEEAIRLGGTEIECIADSELLVKQVNGEYKVKNKVLIPLFQHLTGLIIKFKIFSISHTLRENNKKADKLANFAIDCHK